MLFDLMVLLWYYEFTCKVNFERERSVDITYKNKRLMKICTDATMARKIYGTEMAERIHQRIGEILDADTVEFMVTFKIVDYH